MTHLDLADLMVIGEYSVALLGLIYFVVRYAISTGGDWRRSAEGRHLMFFRGSAAAFMLLGVANNIWPHYVGRDALRITVVGVFALAVLHGDALLERAQAARRRLLRMRDAQRDEQRLP